MPGPDQLIRAAVALPVAIVRRVAGIAAGLLPSGDDVEAPSRPAVDLDLDAAVAAEEALARDRQPPEEAIFTPDDDFFEEEHVDSDIVLVAESADVEATQPPGPEIHVDEPWDGYRRMKVAEITARLKGQPPEALAAVELYEATHRNRRGVLEAVRTATRG